MRNKTLADGTNPITRRATDWRSSKDCAIFVCQGNLVALPFLGG